MAEYRMAPVVKGRAMWQLDPDHIGLVGELETARQTALSEMDKRRRAEGDADELQRALLRAAAGLDRLALLHPRVRDDIERLIRAIWPDGERP